MQAFWPVWTIAFVGLVPLMMGWHDMLAVEWVWIFAVLVVLAFVAASYLAIRRFRWPRRAEAVARVDAALPGRPIAALADQQAIGADDTASQAVWAAHLRRMSDRTKAAQFVEPDLRVSGRDPYGLRYMAVICFVAALSFGSIWRVGSVAETVSGADMQALATGPVWEGWIEPPSYTGKPTLYLADLAPGMLRIPQGSQITLRLYGEVGALTVAETVSGRTGELGPASAAEQSFDVVQSGRIAIDGEGGAAWDITIAPDNAPSIELDGPVHVEALGEMSQPFVARDDYAIATGTATFSLDLDAVDRRYGLTIAPDARADLVLDLPMPFTGDRAEFRESLIEDLSLHPWANLPVILTLTVTDAPGQEGASAPEQMVLPGRRFFQPVAKAVIEQRRDLLWSKDNAARVVDVLRAVSHRPEDVFRRETTYLRLRFILRRLENMAQVGLNDDTQTEIAEALWELAIQLEEGTLADARERLQRAQERLSEAMRNGASDEEIAELMQELREATDDYTRMLAENAQPRENGTDEPDQAGNDRLEFTRDELEALMDRIEELMQEGRMAEAQELMEQLNQLMEDLQVVQDPNAPGQPGQQSMQDLAETLRDQQGLSDDAFRELQDQFNPGGQQPQQGGDGPQQQGEQQGEGQGQGDNPEGGQQNDQGQGGEGQPQEQSLADRQQALRDELERQRDGLPNLGGEAADEAREALDRADGAMDRAEEALRDGDLAEAIDQQAEAMNALRDGLQNLGEAIAENNPDQPGQGEQPGEQAAQREPTRRDPLGRELGENGQLGSEENLLQGQDIYRRAEELLDEIRRRSSDQDRPAPELDYLKRLLDRF